MSKVSRKALITVALAVTACAACSGPSPSVVNTAANGIGNANAPAASEPAQRASTVSNQFTATDIAKLKWLEGTWRGVHEDKPFFERYRFEDTTMVVETLSPENLAKIEHTARFELKDGEFGHSQGKRRSAATEITDDHVQFVPVAGGGNNFRFERQADGTWNAVLEWVGPDNEPKQRIYKMEPYKK